MLLPSAGTLAPQRPCCVPGRGRARAIPKEKGWDKHGLSHIIQWDSGCVKPVPKPWPNKEQGLLRSKVGCPWHTFSPPSEESVSLPLQPVLSPRWHWEP